MVVRPLLLSQVASEMNRLSGVLLPTNLENNPARDRRIATRMFTKPSYNHIS